MTPTNWPNPERPGEPMFPERDGWHAFATGLYEWDAKKRGWRSNTLAPFDAVQRWMLRENYLGPVLTPAQINEMLAAERDRCAKLLEDAYEKTGKDFEYLGCLSCANDIRNLGAAP